MSTAAIRERRPPNPLQRRGVEPTPQRRPADAGAGARPQARQPGVAHRAGQSDFTPAHRPAGGQGPRQQGDTFAAQGQPRRGAAMQQQPPPITLRARHQAVSQIRPEGAEGVDHNAHVRCAAAAVAGLARQSGLFSNMSNAELVRGLAHDNTSRRGSNALAVTDMLRQVRLPIAGQPIVGQVRLGQINRHLEAGNRLIAQVGVRDEQGKAHAHYITISGQHQGKYIVQDPMNGQTQLWPPERLQRALDSAPRSGFAIPVGQPKPGAHERRELANPSTLIPPTMTAGQYAGAVLDMMRGGGQRAMLAASAIYRELSESTNPRDQRAAQRIYERGMAGLDKAKGSVRKLGEEVLRQMRSGDPDQEAAGNARYDHLWSSTNPLERRAARFILRSIMLQDAGGGYRRRNTSFDTF